MTDPGIVPCDDTEDSCEVTRESVLLVSERQSEQLEYLNERLEEKHARDAWTLGAFALAGFVLAALVFLREVPDDLMPLVAPAAIGLLLGCCIVGRSLVTAAHLLRTNREIKHDLDEAILWERQALSETTVHQG